MMPTELLVDDQRILRNDLFRIVEGTLSDMGYRVKKEEREGDFWVSAYSRVGKINVCSSIWCGVGGLYPMVSVVGTNHDISEVLAWPAVLRSIQIDGINDMFDNVRVQQVTKRAGSNYVILGCKSGSDVATFYNIARSAMNLINGMRKYC